MPLQALDIDFAPRREKHAAPAQRIAPLVGPMLTAAAFGLLWWLLRE